MHLDNKLKIILLHFLIFKGLDASSKSKAKKAKLDKNKFIVSNSYFIIAKD